MFIYKNVNVYGGRPQKSARANSMVSDETNVASGHRISGVTNTTGQHLCIAGLGYEAEMLHK